MLRPLPPEQVEAMFDDETTVRNAPPYVRPVGGVRPSPAEAPRSQDDGARARVVALAAELEARDLRIARLEGELARLDHELAQLRSSSIPPGPPQVVPALPVPALSVPALPVPALSMPARFASPPVLGSPSRAMGSEPPPYVTTMAQHEPTASAPAPRVASFVPVTLAICGAIILACAGTALWILEGRPSSAVAPVASSGPSARVAAPPSARAIASARAPAAPSAASSAPSAPSAAVAASSSATVAAPPAVDPASLLSFEGLLSVASPASAQVFVNGVPAGPTNRPLVVRCGWRNVRLGTPERRWLSPGQVVKVACREHTSATIAPSP